VLLAGIGGSAALAKSAEEAETALITGIIGEVTYVRSTESSVPRLVQPFMTLQAGDELTLPDGAQLNVLFINRGIGETWQGPKELQYQPGQLLTKIFGEWRKDRPKLLKLKSLLFEPQKFLSTSGLLGEQQPALKPPSAPPKDWTGLIDKTYSILQKEFGEGDLTPEMYLLSIYEKYGQYDRMTEVLSGLLERFPENPILLSWQKLVEAKQ
jgi:hypothetical protein